LFWCSGFDALGSVGYGGSKKSSAALLAGARNLDERIKAVEAQILAFLPLAKESAEQAIKQVNFNNIFLFVTNLLGGTVGLYGCTVHNKYTP